MKDTQTLVSVLISLARNWKEQSVRAVKEGDGNLYYPARLDNQGFEQIRRFPQTIITGGENEKEPLYLTLEDGQKGRNTDGTLHGGFIIIDVINREVVDVINRGGISVLKADEVGLNLHAERYEPGVEGWINFFRSHEGSFVLVKTHGFWPYANPQCRCPAPQMCVFGSYDAANAKKDKLNNEPWNLENSCFYAVHEIDERFYKAFRAAHCF